MILPVVQILNLLAVIPCIYLHIKEATPVACILGQRIRLSSGWCCWPGGTARIWTLGFLTWSLYWYFFTVPCPSFSIRGTDPQVSAGPGKRKDSQRRTCLNSGLEHRNLPSGKVKVISGRRNGTYNIRGTRKIMECLELEAIWWEVE